MTLYVTCHFDDKVANMDGVTCNFYCLEKLIQNFEILKFKFTEININIGRQFGEGGNDNFEN